MKWLAILIVFSVVFGEYLIGAFNEYTYKALVLLLIFVLIGYAANKYKQEN